MKLPKSVLVNETTKLFSNKYNYKIVLVCSVAGLFRGKRYDYTQSQLAEAGNYKGPWARNITSIDLKAYNRLLAVLRSLNNDDYDIRVETPWISIYTNNTSYIERLADINEPIVKCVYLPSKNIQKIDAGKVVVKTLDFDYKVHLATIRKRDHSSFLTWAKDNSKIRVTKKCITDLESQWSWGGSYFYVKDAKTLTMVKMFLGSDISRVEQVIKG